MPNKPMDSAGQNQPKLTTRSTLARLAIIGAILLGFVTAFAYVGGWLSPDRLTQGRMLDAFQSVNGIHPGFRRNHAKGVCVSGWFDSNGAAQRLSKAAVFLPGRSVLIGRFALAGGMPKQRDSAAAVRSMALSIVSPNGDEWRTGMNNIPVFPVNSAQGFYEQLLASKPDPATGKPNPEAMQKFLAHHPEAVKAIALIKSRTISSGFSDTTFNSLNAFRLVDASGRLVPVRWATEPEQAVTSQTNAPSADTSGNSLFDDLIAQIQKGPLRWHLIITVGQPGDPTADATLPWPAEREKIDAGAITINAISGEDGGPCTDINYDPLVLPPGIEPSDDPLLSARSAAYARSFTLRAGEKNEKVPSAVSLDSNRAGVQP